MTATSAPPSYTRFELPGGLAVSLNSNRKMKTVLFSGILLSDLDEDATRRALIPMVLRRGTRTLPEMQAISRRLESLYGTSFAGYVQKIGEWHALRFRLDVVNPKFLPGVTALLREGLALLVELIEDPLTVEGGFHPEFLEQEKTNLRRSIESLIDNKAAYAEHRLIEEMCPNEPYRIHEQGRLEDIPGIEPGPLLELHRGILRRNPMWLYVAGDIAIEPVRDLIADVFSRGPIRREGGGSVARPPARVPRCPPKQVKETMDVNQARLAIGYRHGITYAHPEYEALLLMNGILGGFSHSKLFQNVREKANMAYSVHSGIERTKGLLIISAGIGPGKEADALAIIEEQVSALRKGEITDDEISATVSTILNSNEMLEDNLGALADVDFVWGLHGRSVDLLAFRDRLRRVSREEIVEAALRLELDTTYLLTR
jgi:predicted Zn-dependent peptidase